MGTIFRTEPAPELIASRPIADPTKTRDAVVAWPAGTRLTRRAAALVEFCQRALGPDPLPRPPLSTRGVRPGSSYLAGPRAAHGNRSPSPRRPEPITSVFSTLEQRAPSDAQVEDAAATRSTLTARMGGERRRKITATNPGLTGPAPPEVTSTGRRRSASVTSLTR